MVSTVGMLGMSGIVMALTTRSKINSILVRMLSSRGYFWEGGHYQG